ncbi:hypothetical protein WHR41_09503 [Cladosporium halotolerans]|uniref:Histidine kinase n=1 Tax=Cladosporium halotolerans TaxID=1052096 RepID=A0AB34KCZ6_9PEZI
MSTLQRSDSERQREPLSNTKARLADETHPDALESFADQMQDALPGDKQAWEALQLGMPGTWPETLLSYSKAIMSFPHPACVYWGEAMVSFHNDEWSKATGIDGQGKSQSGKVSADAFNALSASLQDKAQKRIGSPAFYQHNVGDEAGNYTVSISPLFDEAKPEQVGAHGSLVQLIPKSSCHGETIDKQPVPSDQLESQSPGENAKPNLDPNQQRTAPDNNAFDKHPFFNRFADMLPTGLAILDHNAQAFFVNRTFHELTVHCGEDQQFTSWSQAIHPDDQDRVMRAYHNAFATNKQLRTEFRALGQQRPWRLLFMMPFDGDDLRHISICDQGGFICCVVDITCEKGAALVERKAAKDANEARVQQERFIDMISHEIRNPLSAMLHCAEDIDEAVSDPNNFDISSIKEAIETINICIQHQQGLVDDVLSYSKLDASMLRLSPKTCLPDSELGNSLKLFTPEFRRQDIDMDYNADPSYAEFDVSWVKADMTRISQILMNLVSNAIKFTVKAQGDKNISISIGASMERPSSYPPNVVFFRSEEHALMVDSTNSAEWGSGEALYVMVAVKDTGIGISEEGQQRLFERFMVPTPKTAEMYGGSGLGLNISRKLCHLHGGEVGVSSKVGEGSTFGFFFKVRRSKQPQDHDDMTKEPSVEDADIKNLRSAPHEGVGDELVSRSSNYSHAKDAVDKLYRDNFQQDDVPQKSKLPDPADQHEARSTSSPRISHHHHHHHHHHQHVLLVEDNLINQQIVCRKLKAKGYVVTTANDGKEAIDLATSAPKLSTGDEAAFDICLMDMEMPRMDGNAATKAIRELERKGAIEYLPILGVTANVRSEQQDKMKAAGMDDVISKPYRIEEMVSKIQQLLGTRND